ncbi:MAG: hypothetical protein ACYCXW_07605, partial [Solirubrobacteraceae bacterium]
SRRGAPSRREFDEEPWDPAELDALDGQDPEERPSNSRGRSQPGRRLPGAGGRMPEGGERATGRRRTPPASGADRPSRGRRTTARPAVPGIAREPRHVHAVPTSIEHRISSAVELFNESEHTRTISGVARSLGLPEVSVHPSDIGGSVVWLVVAWELCWYRYEADLSDEIPAVRLAGQGYELSELDEAERQANAVADERGRLHLA